MVILRAGPFASSLDSFLDEPVAPVGSELPVNCAKDTTSTNWPWRYYQISTNVTASYETGLPSLTDASINTGPIESVQGSFSFRYQAAEAFTMELSYSASGSTSGGFFDVSNAGILVTVGETIVFDDSDSDSDTEGSGRPTSASISGVETIDLPASVLPLLVLVSISASGSSLVACSSANYSASLTS